jgi:SAM-dependent methyltransferase
LTFLEEKKRKKEIKEKKLKEIFGYFIMKDTFEKKIELLKKKHLYYMQYFDEEKKLTIDKFETQINPVLMGTPNLAIEDAITIKRFLKLDPIFELYKTKEVQFWYCKKICEEIIKDVEKNPSRKYNILLLGVDLGGILINLTNKLNNVFIIGIDISDIYFNIIEKFSPPNTFKLIKTDAEQFMREQRKNTFDYIICDIFDGIKLPDFVLSNEFLSNINKNLRPGGKFLINTIGVYYLTIKDKFEKIFLNSEIRFETEYPYIYILNLLNLVTIVSKL